MNVPRTVWIVPGFGEGDWHARRLMAALARKGYKQSADLQSADIIITHSAGCYFLPTPAPARQHIILINPTFWPGKSALLSMLQKVWRDFMACMHRQLFLFWLVKTSWNIVYIIGMPVRGYRMARLTHKHDLHAALRKRPAVIIRSSNDSWLTPDAKTLLAAEHITHFDVHGQHDDCWLHTTEYAALIDTIIKEGARLKP